MAIAEKVKAPPPAGGGETKIQRCKKRAHALNDDRATFEPHWREIQRFVSPRLGRFCLEEQNRDRKKDQHIYNSTATMASKTLGAGMFSGMTNPARPWFRLATFDPNVMEVTAVRDWLYVVEERMRNVLAGSNLYYVLPSTYRELGDFGTAAIYAEPDAKDVIRFYPLTIGTYWLGTDSRRDVDTLRRKLKMTVRQMVEKFGYENCSATVQSAWTNGSLETTYDIEHLIQPNVDRDSYKLDAKNKAWSSCYWEMGNNSDKFLRESGYDNKPFVAPRWDLIGEDTYGSSPGMDALADVKSLQVRELQFSEAVEKHIRPPTYGPANLQDRTSSFLPGSHTSINPGQDSGGIKAIYQTEPDYAGAVMDKNDIKGRIRDCYYTSLFLAISGQVDDPSKTAYEISQINQERLLMLGPVLQRLNSEMLDPIIDMTFEAMLQQSTGLDPSTWLIPPPPPELAGQPLKVEYTSVLATALKLLEVGSITQFMQFIGSVAPLDSQILDVVDFDQAAQQVGNDLGVPPSIIRSDDDIAAIRQQKAQQQQQQMLAAQAPAIAQYAKAAKDAGQATASPGSLLGAAGAAINQGAGG
jgi:hypothetical protein